MSADSQPQKIAIAVVLNGHEVLIGPRQAAVELGGYWEFPGGKVQPGETIAQAAARECLEETSLVVDVLEELLCASHTYPHGRLELHFLRCAPREALPPAAPFIWAPITELPNYEFPPANAAALLWLRDRQS